LLDEEWINIWTFFTPSLMKSPSQFVKERKKKIKATVEEKKQK
jgi:hypothetical protein